MIKNSFLKKLTSSFSILALSFGVSAVHVELAVAAALTTLSDTQSSVKVNTLSDHTIQFVTPTGVAAGTNIAITFPAGFTLGQLSFSDVDFATSTSASCSGFADATLAASQSGLTWGVATSSQTLTITSGTAVIPANRCIQIEIGSNATFGTTGQTRITNPATPNSYQISIAGTFGDTGTITANIITDDTVSVTATVQQSLTFTISTSTIYFGNLSSSFAKFASSTNPAGDTADNVAHTLAVGTNAPSGYNITLRGQTLTSLQSASNTISAMGASPVVSVAGSEQFGVRATVSGGTGAVVDPTYASTTAFGFDATATTSSILATGSGATNVSTYSLRYVANIAAITEAGTYAANMVYVATANF